MISLVFSSVLIYPKELYAGANVSLPDKSYNPYNAFVVTGINFSNYILAFVISSNGKSDTFDKPILSYSTYTTTSPFLFNTP